MNNKYLSLGYITNKRNKLEFLCDGLLEALIVLER